MTLGTLLNVSHTLKRTAGFNLGRRRKRQMLSMITLGPSLSREGLKLRNKMGDIVLVALRFGVTFSSDDHKSCLNVCVLFICLRILELGELYSSFLVLAYK